MGGKPARQIHCSLDLLEKFKDGIDNAQVDLHNQATKQWHWHCGRVEVLMTVFLIRMMINVIFVVMIILMIFL